MIAAHNRYSLAKHQGGVSLDATCVCPAVAPRPAIKNLRIERAGAASKLMGHPLPFFAAIKPVIGEIDDMRHYEVTPVTSAMVEA